MRSTDLFFPIIEGKTIFVSSTAKRQRGLQRGKLGSPLPCFASFCRSKRKAPAASGANYAFAKGCVTPTGEIKLLPFAGNPSVSLAADSLSLRLGHGAALICHRHIIHYRAATSLPLAQGSLWVGAAPAPCARVAFGLCGTTLPLNPVKNNEPAVKILAVW